jgi:superfamily II DNA or RNA helicase
VHAAALRAATGVVDALPRSGKTLMAARLIAVLGQPTLYLAPSVQIVRQTHEVLSTHFGRDLIGRFDGGADEEDRDLERPIIVATPNSALRLPKEFLATRAVLIVDEFHHGAAEMYHRISMLCENAYYRYGFTGTHFRTGEDTLAMEALCSTTIEKIGLHELVPNYLANPRVFFLPVKGKVEAEGFDDAYDQGIVNCEARNDRIIEVVNGLQKKMIPTIVLARRRAHADALGQRLSDAVVVKGNESALTSRSVRDFLDGRYSVLVGTSVIGEGVDVPRAAALVYASGGNDGVSMMQSYFRPLTAFKGKDAGRIYDFWDRHHSMLRRQSSNRFHMAQEQFGPQRVFRLE